MKFLMFLHYTIQINNCKVFYYFKTKKCANFLSKKALMHTLYVNFIDITKNYKECLCSYN